MANKQKALMWVMFVIIIILAAVLIYVFVIRPTITGYAVDRQNEGIAFCMQNIVNQVQQNGFVQFPLGEGQTLYLAPFNPQQAQQPQQQAPVQ